MKKRYKYPLYNVAKLSDISATHSLRCDAKQFEDRFKEILVSRALPDVRDGFKPVHRRILFGMMGLGNTLSLIHISYQASPRAFQTKCAKLSLHNTQCHRRGFGIAYCAKESFAHFV